MIERFHIGVYWGGREEHPSACAERLLRMLTAIRDCHGLVNQWHDLAETIEEAVHSVIPLTHSGLEKRLLAADPAAPLGLGYEFAAWNGHPDCDQQVDMSIVCGSVPKVAMCNHAVLWLPCSPDDMPASVASLYQSDVLLSLLDAMVRAWRPEHGRVMGRLHAEQVDDHARPVGQPMIGWMTYLCASRLAQVTGAPPCETVDIPGYGTVFVLTRAHRFSVDRADDVERARALTEFLEAHGALVGRPPHRPEDTDVGDAKG